MDIKDFTNGFLRPTLNTIYSKYENHMITEAIALDWGESLLTAGKLIDGSKNKPDSALMNVWSDFINKMEGSKEC